MLFCNCILAGTVACLKCPNNNSFHNFTYNPPVKIIEKFDDKGNLIERITETVNGI